MDEKAVFLTFLGLPEDQREAFLDKACPDEIARERIRTLLRHHGEATEDFLSERTKSMTEPERPTRSRSFGFSIDWVKAAWASFTSLRTRS